MNSSAPKDKKKSKSVHAVLLEYTLYTTIHGIRYIFEDYRHWTERIWWTMAFLLSVLICGWQLTYLYAKWQDSPVIVSFADKTTPIWDIPFPAVTICSETKSKKSELDFGDIYEKMRHHNFDSPVGIVTKEEFKRYRALQEVCVSKSHQTNNFVRLDENIGDILREITLNETIGGADYHGQENEDFTQIMTQEGVCYTMNMMRPKQFYQDGVVNEIRGLNDDREDGVLNLDNRYHDHESMSYDELFDSYPRRSFLAGIPGGLFAILLHPREDLDYLCGSALSGFRILLHPPYEFPQVHQYFNRLPLEKSLNMAVRPRVMSTSDNLRSYEPARRQCIFNGERKLKYFRVYTERNCELECLTEHTKKSCGCVRLGMPRFNTTRNCDTSNRQCYKEAEFALLKYSLLENNRGRPQNDYCNCLPSCMHVSYDAEITQADLKLEEAIEASEHLDSTSMNLKSFFTSSLSVYFKEKQFTENRRSELYGPSEFLANFGGTLGLFMGISLLSVVELLYFCTLRLFFNNVQSVSIEQPDLNETCLEVDMVHTL